jgi:protein O-mannosyl-transferase
VALLGWVLYLGMGIYAAVRIWKRDVVALGILMYLAPLSLVVNILFNIGAPMADHFLYAPSFGFCLAAGFLLVKFTKVDSFAKLKKNMSVSGLLLVVAVLFSYKTIARNPAWFNNNSLFAADVHASPNSAKIHYYYANTLLKQFLDKGEVHLRNPDASDLILLDSSEVHFMRSYEINPKFHHTTYNLGLVNIHKRKPQEALKWLQYTLTLQPNHGISHEQLVRVYGEFLNQPDKALEHLNIALGTVEGQKNAANYQYLGNLMAMKGNVEKAEQAFLKAAGMKPSIARSCYMNLAGMYGNMVSQAEAQGDVVKAAAYRLKVQEYSAKAEGR